MALRIVAHEPNRSTRVRWIIVFIICLVSFISYLLRTNLSIAGDRVRADLGLSQIQLGLVFSAFAWGYAIFQFPGGILGEIMGSRKALTFIAILWAILTLLTGLVPGGSLVSTSASLGFLILIRFLAGASHAPLFPVVGGTIGNWFPVSSWSFPNGLTSAALNLGAAATAPLIVWLMSFSGWRGSFLLSSPLGLLAALMWWIYVRNYPSEHRSVSKTELDLIDADRPPPVDMNREKDAWKVVIRNREVLLLTISYFCMNYIFYLIFNWFFIYLLDVRHVPERQASYFTASQYIVGSIGAVLGGFFADNFAKRIGPRWGYRMLPLPCLLLSGVCVVAGAFATNSYLAVVMFAACMGLTQVTDPIYWGAIVAVSGRHAASASGVLNTGGNVVGGIGAVLVPYLAKQFGWQAAIASGAIFTTAAALLWLLIRADETMKEARSL